MVWPNEGVTLKAIVLDLSVSATFISQTIRRPEGSSRVRKMIATKLGYHPCQSLLPKTVGQPPTKRQHKM